MDLFSEVAFKTSKIVTKTYSTSFSLAVSMLGKEMQNAINSIYGFVRFADEIVDTFHQNNKKHLLEKFEDDLKDALNEGLSLNPILHSFALTIKKYDIDKDLIDAFLSSMKADLNKQNYNTQNELNEYIYGSADVVGLMCLKVFVNGDQNQFNNLKVPAIKLGSAFQKVNFLRDLKADTEGLNRTYFHQLNSGHFNESAKHEIIANIELDFKEAKKGIEKLPGKSKLAVYIAFSYYNNLLKKLKKTPAEKIVSARIRISDSKKVLILIKAYLKYNLGLI
jgi:phytoene/squalene synthetase